MALYATTCRCYKLRADSFFQKVRCRKFIFKILISQKSSVGRLFLRKVFIYLHILDFGSLPLLTWCSFAFLARISSPFRTKSLCLRLVSNKESKSLFSLARLDEVRYQTEQGFLFTWVNQLKRV